MLLFTLWKLRKESVDTEEVVDKYNDLHNATEKERLAHYQRLVLAYYNLSTVFYEFGWGDCFHFAIFKPGETFDESILRHEYELVEKMKIQSGQSILDVGCGIGGPARNIASKTKCIVTGLNINTYQIGRAKTDTASRKLNNQVRFIIGDFCKMEFGSETFDGCYAIESTCHAPKREDVYGEIFRVIKKGRYFAVYEWCLTDKYNPNDPNHQKIRKNIEIGNGLPSSVHHNVCLQALKNVGFEVVEHRDVFAGDKSWWKYFDASFNYPSTFQFSDIGRWIYLKILLLLEIIGLAPRGIVKVADVLMKAASGLKAGGQEGIFTVGYYILARKP